MTDRLYPQPIPLPPGVPSQHRIAGGWVGFSDVLLHTRDAAPAVIPASDLPQEVLTRLTEPRAPLKGLALDEPRVMGVLNVTPDSFSDGGLHDAAGKAVAAATKLVGHGADILDIGGESTRPGAKEVPADVEWARIAPVLEAQSTASPALLSVDTRKASVAARALAQGADMINDVSAGQFDPDMLATVAASGVALCLMHAQGLPETMQDAPAYGNVLLDVFDALAARVVAAEAAGIPRSRLWIDPGIGFGKTQAHNLALLRGVGLFHALGCPILLGVSRKGFIGRIGHAPNPADRAPGSIAVGLSALAQGVQVLRVHDVEETCQAVRLWQALAQSAT